MVKQKKGEAKIFFLMLVSLLFVVVGSAGLVSADGILPLATYGPDDAGDYSLQNVRSIAFSPDGNYLAISSYSDDVVSIMNIIDKTQILPLASYHDDDGNYSVDGVMSIAFSSDGNYLATSSNLDDVVSIMETGLEAATFGNLTLSWISPDESTYVAQNEFWNYTFNLSCSSGGDCGFVEVTLDPWAIDELMAGNDLQLDSKGNVVGVVEAESAIIEKNWLAKVMEFVKEIFKN